MSIMSALRSSNVLLFVRIAAGKRWLKSCFKLKISEIIKVGETETTGHEGMNRCPAEDIVPQLWYTVKSVMLSELRKVLRRFLP